MTLTLKQNIDVDFDARSITSAGDANYQIDVDATRRTGKTRVGQLVFHIVDVKTTVYILSASSIGAWDLAAILESEITFNDVSNTHNVLDNNLFVLEPK